VAWGQIAERWAPMQTRSEVEAYLPRLGLGRDPSASGSAAIGRRTKIQTWTLGWHLPGAYLHLKSNLQRTDVVEVEESFASGERSSAMNNKPHQFRARADSGTGRRAATLNTVAAGNVAL